MPRWRVSEPYINLWVHDVPLFYRLSSGKWIPFKMTYKGRGAVWESTFGGFGEGWTCNFLSMVQANTNGATRDFYTNYVAGGGTRRSMSNNVPDPWGKILMFGTGPGGRPIPIYRDPRGGNRKHGQDECFGAHGDMAASRWCVLCYGSRTRNGH